MKDEIMELENYLWLFTKDYPTIYEVLNKKGELSLNIVGETELFDKIKTLYKVKLDDSKEAAKFYKLTKALFILQTELPHYYKFETNINIISHICYVQKQTQNTLSFKQQVQLRSSRPTVVHSFF